MNRYRLFMMALAATGLALGAAGCGRPFDIKTPPGFVELKDQDPPYAYRATTPEGVVIAMRVIDNDDERGDLDFWTKAITLKMRDQEGYAALKTEEVKAKDGTPGRRLVFGHDEDGKPYAYWVTIWLAQGRILVLETGGAQPEVERYAKSIGWIQQEVRVRCAGFLAPVLSSRTCNRW